MNPPSKDRNDGELCYDWPANASHQKARASGPTSGFEHYFGRGLQVFTLKTAQAGQKPNTPVTSATSPTT